MDTALGALARHAGIFARYTDQTGRERRSSEETLRAVLCAMGYDAGTESGVGAELARVAAQARRLPEHVIAVPGRVPGVDVAGDWVLTWEDGSVREGRGSLPALPLGRHRLDAGDETVWILSAPRRLPLPVRGWGVTLPFYGLRGPARGGLADYRDLAEAVRGLGQAGAGFVGINPIHAGFADPSMISPYSPSHRRRLSVAHLHVPGEAAVPAGALVDYPAALAARRAALEARWTEGVVDEGFGRFRAVEGAALERFALYEALAERFGPTWDRWPEAYRDVHGAAAARFAGEARERIGFHQWLQYLAQEQLREVAEAARQAGMAQGLYLDLAVGTHPHGAETWTEPGSFAAGVSLGAPPDAFSPGGQVWNIAPFNPRSLKADGFAALAATLAAQLRHAGMLRVDHILGFERAFWVPESGAPGTYVAMPKAAMLAVVRIEAARAGAVIVGEDLGNIPEGLEGDLKAAGILGCQVAMFEGARAAGRYRSLALASFGTHDLPTWKGWRIGADIAARVRIGAMEANAAKDAMAVRAREVAALDRRLEGAGVDDMHRFLGRARSRLVALQAEDILGVADQPNLPGTVDSYPNWRRVLPVAAEDLGGDPRVRRAARIMRDVGRLP